MESYTQKERGTNKEIPGNTKSHTYTLEVDDLIRTRKELLAVHHTI